jgi:hypothetical protein
VSYSVQRAAEAVYSERGKREVRERIYRTTPVSFARPHEARPHVLAV